MVQTTAIKKKICLLGSFAVGKTSLVERFVYDRFDEKYLTTIGVKISQKLLPPVQDTRSGRLCQHNFLIWDLVKFCKKFLSASPQATLVVLGNKKDIFQQNEPMLADLQKLADGYSTDLLLTSAKTGDQVENAFVILSNKIGSR